MIENVLVGIGVIVAIIALLDFLLTDGTKTRLTSKLKTVRKRLNDVKKLKFLDWIGNRRFRLIFLFVVVLMVETAGCYLLYESFSGWRGVSIGVLGAIGALIVIRLGDEKLALVANVHTRREAVREVLGSTGHSIGAILLGSFLLLGVRFGEHLLLQSLYVFLGLLAICHLIIVISILAPLGAAYGAASIVWACEYFVLRVLHYPKGPLVALGVFLAALVALIKTLQSS